MAIRVFLTQWYEEPDGPYTRIKNQLDDYLGSVTLSAPVISQNFYARRAIDGRPDKNFLLKIVRGDLLDSEWQAINGVAEATMIQPARFDKALNTLAMPVQNAIKNTMGDYGIPLTIWDTSPTIGALLRQVVQYLDSSRDGFGAIEGAPEEWA